MKQRLDDDRSIEYSVMVEWGMCTNGNTACDFPRTIHHSCNVVEPDWNALRCGKSPDKDLVERIMNRCHRFCTFNNYSGRIEVADNAPAFVKSRSSNTRLRNHYDENYAYYFESSSGWWAFTGTQAYKFVEYCVPIPDEMKRAMIEVSHRESTECTSCEQQSRRDDLTSDSCSDCSECSDSC